MTLTLLDTSRTESTSARASREARSARGLSAFALSSDGEGASGNPTGAGPVIAAPIDVNGASGPGSSQLLTQTFDGTSYNFSGNRNIDAALIGSRWTFLNQTFSFPTAGSNYVGYVTGENTTGFSAFNAAQQTGVRYALNLVSQYTPMTFTEIAETDTTHATHRFGNTTVVGSAYGNFPSDFFAAGDAWFNLGQPFYATPAAGNWGLATIMHEIGHTLGLKHGHQDYTTLDLSGDLHVAGPRFGSRSLTPENDGQAYSLMTYRGGIGQPISFQGDGFNQPQSYMQYDIAALQYMYGANYNTNSGNSAYTFNTTTGEMLINGVSQGAPTSNIVFRTVWDGGGTDTYDLSNYSTNLSLNLEAGGWLVFDTTAATHFQRANNQPLSGVPTYAPGNVANALLFNDNAASLIENAVGGSGADELVGNRAANTLDGGGGADALYGAGGDDVLRGGAGGDVLYGDNGPIGVSGVGIGTGLVTHGYGNISLATALSVTNTFSIANNADIVNSTTIPHTTARFTTPAAGVLGASYYSMTLNAGSKITLDIDHTALLDSYIRLLDASGNIIAFNDDNGGDAGSTTNLDSALTFTAAYTGVYYVTVGRFGSPTALPNNATYDLNISVAPPATLGLDGAAGNDTLAGGAGVDYIDGGGGNNTVDYRGDAAQGGAAGVTINLAYVNNYAVDGFGSFDTLVNIQNAFGTNAGDLFFGSAAANGFIGGAGNDYVSMGGGADYIGEAGGNNTLIGGAGSDTVSAGAGNDLILGYDFSTLDAGVTDYIYGGGGNDAIYIAQGGIGVVFGDAGADTVVGSTGADYVNGGAGADYITEVSGANTLQGGLGQDIIIGGSGADLIIGGDFSASDAGVWDYLYGGGGADRVYTASAGNGYLNGGDGADTLYGSSGTDWLQGGVGADALVGGTGTETFYTAFADMAAGNADYVSGFHAGDLIGFSAALSGQVTYFQSGTTAYMSVALGGGNFWYEGVASTSVAQLQAATFFSG